MKYEFRYRAGHVEVLNEYGEFMFSADNEREAREEIMDIEAA